MGARGDVTHTRSHKRPPPHGGRPPISDPKVVGVRFKSPGGPVHVSRFPQGLVHFTRPTPVTFRVWPFDFAHATSRRPTALTARIRLEHRSRFIEAPPASLQCTRFPSVGTSALPLRTFKTWQRQHALSHATLAISHCVCCGISLHLPNGTAIPVGYGHAGHIPLCLLWNSTSRV